MDIRRGDVRRRYLRKHIMRELDTRRFEPGLIKRELLRRGLRRLGQKTGFLELQAAGRINRPCFGEPISVGQANVAPLVIGEIEIVISEPVRDPVWHADGRWAWDVPADARMQVRCNDRSIKRSDCAHAWLLIDVI